MKQALQCTDAQDHFFSWLPLLAEHMMITFLVSAAFYSMFLIYFRRNKAVEIWWNLFIFPKPSQISIQMEFQMDKKDFRRYFHRFEMLNKSAKNNPSQTKLHEKSEKKVR